MMRWLTSLVTVFLLAASLRAQLPPEDVIKSMSVAEGLQVELFAAEPMLINPTSMDIDPAGRVWVTEAVNYRCILRNKPFNRAEGDRIQVLIDTNGDGKADGAKTFYQGKELIAPLGIAIAPIAKGGYRVFVCQSPNILVFEDKDGDLKADGPPTKFLTGFGGVDHDHGVHGINIGPDGKLYFTVGDGGVKGLQATDGKGPKFTSNTTDVQKGTVWRCDMDGKNLELIAHNFRNNYECCVNSFGEVWLSDNDDDGNQQTRICFVMPGGNYGYGPRGKGESHWHEEQPGIVHKTLRTGFGSPTGITFYEGSLLPEKYRGQLLHTDAGPRELRCFHIKPKGAGYELDKTVMIASSDNWFRPSDVCVAPDGSVMVADWYDPGVGGHGMGDTTRGRIYRITPKGHVGYKVSEVKLETKEGLLAALRSPCLSTRAGAVGELRGQNPPIIQGVHDALQADPSPLLRARSLMQLHTEEPGRVGLVKRFLDTMGRNQEPDAVKLAILRQLGTIRRAGQFGGVNFSENSLKTLAVESPAVRRGLLLMLADYKVELAKEPFFALAKKYDGQDLLYRAALNIACGTDPARRDAILADFPKHFPEWNDGVADLVWELRPKSMMPKLNAMLADAKLTGPQKARIVDILAASDDPKAGDVMFKLVTGEQPTEVKLRAIENLRLFLPNKWKAAATSPELRIAVDRLLDSPKTRGLGLQLSVAANFSAAVDGIAKLAEQESEPLDDRLAAVRAMGKINALKSVTTLANMANPSAGGIPNGLRLEAVAALGEHVTQQAKDPASQQALTALQSILTAKNTPDDLSKAAVAALTGTRPGTDYLLDLKEKNQMPEAAIAEAGKLLRNSPFQGQRNRALILFPAAAKIDPKKLVPADLAKRALGNVEKGKAVLTASLTGNAQCLKCHTVRGIGGQVGPDLSMIGKKGSRENIFESLLQPSKAIADQYVQLQVTTAAGLTVSGLPIAETAKDLTLRDANGKDTTILKDDIEARKPIKTSIMADDIVSSLTEEELNDLVTYLQTLQTAALTPETWKVSAPFLSPGGNKGLGKAYLDESAPATDAWKTIRANAAGYFDLAALHGKAGANSVSYLQQMVESPVEQDAEILLGTDDGAKLFVNGTQVFESQNTQSAVPGRDSVKVKLKAGKNTILLKIANGSNPHGFYFTMLSGQEVKVAK